MNGTYPAGLLAVLGWMRTVGCGIRIARVRVGIVWARRTWRLARVLGWIQIWVLMVSIQSLSFTYKARLAGAGKGNVYWMGSLEEDSPEGLGNLKRGSSEVGGILLDSQEVGRTWRKLSRVKIIKRSTSGTN